MDYLIEILKYIGPFIGVLIGWFLSRKSEKDKIKYDEQKRVKRILFILLEIRNELLQSKKMDKYLRVYIDKVKVKFNIDESEYIDSSKLKVFLKGLLMKVNGENNHFDLNNQFNECVDNLSEIDPFLAYRINGKQNIRSFIENWENETKKVLESENINEVENMVSHFRPKLVDEIQNDLSEIISEVTELTSDKNLKEEISEFLKEPTESDYENDIGEYIDRMFDGIE
jgi:hypothetical protein